MDQTYGNKAIDINSKKIIRKSTIGLNRWLRVVKHSPFL